MSSSKSCCLLILFFIFLLLILDSAALTSLSTCQNNCGQIEIPYPFGIGKGCYLDKGYEIECKTVSGEEIPFLSVSSKEVVDISLPSQYFDKSMSHASLHIKSPVTTRNKQEFGSLLNSTGQRNSQWLHAKQYATLELEWSFRTTNPSLITSLGCQDKLQYTGLSYKINCTCQNKTDSGIIYASCGCTEGYRGNPYLLGGCKGNKLPFIFFFFLFPFKLYKIISLYFCYFTYSDINECKEYNSEGDPIHCRGNLCVNFQGGHRCKFSNYDLSSLTLGRSLIFLFAGDDEHIDCYTNLKVCFLLFFCDLQPVHSLLL